MKVLLMGASGLTGGMVLDGLLAAPEVSIVIAPLRRELDREHPKLRQVAVDFDRLGEQEHLFDVDTIVCCLGTTIKKAGSRERFRNVDYGFAMKAAEAGHQRGVSSFILMSAMGASSTSQIFYNRVKGELEDGVRALGFPYMSIYQPGLLLGERDEQRRAEALGIKAMPVINALLRGPLEKYRGIRADVVARAMVHEVCRHDAEPPGSQCHIRTYRDIVALAELSTPATR